MQSEKGNDIMNNIFDDKEVNELLIKIKNMEDIYERINDNDLADDILNRLAELEDEFMKLIQVKYNMNLRNWRDDERYSDWLLSDYLMMLKKEMAYDN